MLIVENFNIIIQDAVWKFILPNENRDANLIFSNKIIDKVLKKRNFTN